MYIYNQSYLQAGVIRFVLTLFFPVAVRRMSRMSMHRLPGLHGHVDHDVSPSSVAHPVSPLFPPHSVSPSSHARFSAMFADSFSSPSERTSVGVEAVGGAAVSTCRRRSRSPISPPKSTQASKSTASVSFMVVARRASVTSPN